MRIELVDGVFAFLGAGIGSALAYLGTRNATKAERTARRREEWGRRFTAALQALTSEDARRRATGRALLVELMRSGLATEDDRREAAAVLEAAATHDVRGDLWMAPSTGDLDDLEIVRDTGGSDDQDEEDRA
jgi:hypothetical protein